MKLDGDGNSGARSLRLLRALPWVIVVILIVVVVCQRWRFKKQMNKLNAELEQYKQPSGSAAPTMPIGQGNVQMNDLQHKQNALN